MKVVPSPFQYQPLRISRAGISLCGVHCQKSYSYWLSGWTMSFLGLLWL